MTQTHDISFSETQFLFLDTLNPHDPPLEDFLDKVREIPDPDALWTTIQEEESYLTGFKGPLTEEEVCTLAEDIGDVFSIFRISLTQDDPIVEDITEQVADKYLEIFETEYDPEEPIGHPFIRNSEAYETLRHVHEREERYKPYTPYPYTPTYQEPIVREE